LGKLLPRNTILKIELHHINQTDVPILRELGSRVLEAERGHTQFVQDISCWRYQPRCATGAISRAQRCHIGGDTRILDIFVSLPRAHHALQCWRTRGDQKDLFYRSSIGTTRRQLVRLCERTVRRIATTAVPVHVRSIEIRRATHSNGV